MQRPKKLTLCLLLLLTSSTTARGVDNVSRILSELDSAAARFKNAVGDFDWQTAQTEPILDTETQSGVIYFRRSGDSFQVSAHIHLMNGQRVPKVLGYSNGTATLFEALTGDFRQFKAGQRQAQLESVLLLGFGSSGKEIADKWNVSFVRQEMVARVNCEVLELIPKDPELRKSLRRATIWVDASRGVALKQVLDEDQGVQRVCVYTNLRMNTNLPANAFDPKAIDAESPQDSQH